METYLNIQLKIFLFQRALLRKDKELLSLVDHLSDKDLEDLKPGGHDPEKVFAAFNEAINHKGQPTAILARTIKGYGMEYRREKILCTPEKVRQRFSPIFVIALKWKLGTKKQKVLNCMN